MTASVHNNPEIGQGLSEPLSESVSRLKGDRWPSEVQISASSPGKQLTCSQTGRHSCLPAGCLLAFGFARVPECPGRRTWVWSRRGGRAMLFAATGWLVGRLGSVAVMEIGSRIGDGDVTVKEKEKVTTCEYNGSQRERTGVGASYPLGARMYKHEELHVRCSIANYCTAKRRFIYTMFCYSWTWGAGRLLSPPPPIHHALSNGRLFSAFWHTRNMSPFILIRGRINQLKLKIH